VKVLIAGLGSIGQRHARNLRALFGNGVEILAHRVRGLPHVITETMTIEPDGVVEDRYGIRSFAHLDDALAEHPVAAIICNPTSAHVEAALAAVRAGCHVLIEKPLSHAMHGVDELMSLAEEQGVVAAVGYQMRFHPALVRLRELLCRRAVGPVRSVRAEWQEYLPDAHPYEDYRHSYAARADLGGGVILCYIHELDYLTWLFGMPRRISTTGGRSGALDCDVEDTAVCLIEHDVDGRVVPVELRLSFAARPRVRRCEIHGAEGTIHVDLEAPSIEVARPGAVADRIAFPSFSRNQPFLDELRHFFAAIDGSHPPSAPLPDAVRSLRVALAARESLATGEGVELT